MEHSTCRAEAPQRKGDAAGIQGPAKTDLPFSRETLKLGARLNPASEANYDMSDMSLRSSPFFPVGVFGNFSLGSLIELK